jgi:hypothetical protein
MASRIGRNNTEAGCLSMCNYARGVSFSAGKLRSVVNDSKGQTLSGVRRVDSIVVVRLSEEGALCSENCCS